MSARSISPLGFVAALPLVACVLLVDPPSYSTRCHLVGDTTACGACLTQHCQTSLDACCLDSGNGALALTESCSTRHDGACAELRLLTLSKDPSEKALASCVANSCPSVCVDYAGTSKTSCQVLGGPACSCMTPGAGALANDEACSETIFPEDLCCASPGWPGSAASCQCLPLECSPTSEGCQCSLCQFAGAGSVPSCNIGQCCAMQDACSCRVTGCTSGETPVSACSVKVVDCVAPTKRVSSCSLRGP